MREYLIKLAYFSKNYARFKNRVKLSNMGLTIDPSDILQCASELKDCNGTHFQSHKGAWAPEFPSTEVQTQFAIHDTCVPWCVTRHREKRTNLSQQDDWQLWSNSMALAIVLSFSYMHRNILQAASLLSPPLPPRRNARSTSVERWTSAVLERLIWVSNMSTEIDSVKTQMHHKCI
jgi:hypothetical protein